VDRISFYLYAAGLGCWGIIADVVHFPPLPWAISGIGQRASGGTASFRPPVAESGATRADCRGNNSSAQQVLLTKRLNADRLRIGQSEPAESVTFCAPVVSAIRAKLPSDEKSET
jgi:hypothetical protein